MSQPLRTDRDDGRGSEPLAPRPIEAPSAAVLRRLLVVKVVLVAFVLGLLVILSVAISGALR